MFDVIVIGGGAAGFFAAIHMAEADPKLKIAILERGKEVLTKVKVSGGGRCNVTHAEFDPKSLTLNYPRGEKELLGPFHTFCTGDTIGFFEKYGIPLKIEQDGRVFPISDSSQTIIDFFLGFVENAGIRVLRGSSVTHLSQSKEAHGTCWEVTTIKGTYSAKKVVVATGSNPKIWQLLQQLGHTIEPAVPSLFTFNITDKRIAGIQGVSTTARVEIVQKKTANPKITIPLASKLGNDTLLASEGPLLITHWGMSGPAILKLSAWGAKILAQLDYRFNIRVNWLPEYHVGAVIEMLLEIKAIEVKKTVLRTKAVDLPRRLWVNLVAAADIKPDLTWAAATKGQLQRLADQLTKGEFVVNGKSTFKEEFVTAGGVDLKEINFKTLESKVANNLYFAGEIINVDGITGGFNFQNAWTTAYLAAQAIVNSK